MGKACVIGDPIGHSLSPVIHHYWLDQYGIEGEYQKKHITPDNLTEFLDSMVENGYSGCNVTIPHKEAVKEYLQQHGELTQSAEDIGAVNTIMVKNGTLIGDNTDHYGFIENLRQAVGGDAIEGKKVLLLGAGGASKGLIYSLINHEVDCIYLTNRTFNRSVELAANYDKVQPIEWDEIDDVLDRCDIIVNATSLGMVGQPSLALDLSQTTPGKIVTDIVFNPLYTDLLVQAKKYDHTIVDGLGMLLHQAAPGFKMFFDPQGERLDHLPVVSTELRKKIEEKL